MLPEDVRLVSFSDVEQLSFVSMFNQFDANIRPTACQPSLTQA